MKALGKALFWIGFVALIGVVLAYLIIILSGAVAFATTATALSICAIILIGSLLMLMGRSYEKSGERKEELRRIQHMNTKIDNPAGYQSIKSGKSRPQSQDFYRFCRFWDSGISFFNHVESIFTGKIAIFAATLP